MALQYAYAPVADGASEVEAATSRRSHPLSYPEAGVDVAPQHLAGLVTAVPKVNESAGAWSVHYVTR